jgi:hypothetical protein
MPAKRAVIRLELELSVKQALDDLCERRGMTQISVTSRLVHWLLKQDEIVQASVMGLLPETVMGELSQLLLKRLAACAGGARQRGAAQGPDRRRSIAEEDDALASRPAAQ